MKKNILRAITITFLVVLAFTLIGCNSKDKKEDKKTDTKKEEVVEGFYVDEESGEIVDAATGETVTDGSVKVDEKTGDIVDTKTGETLQTKKETEKVKEEVKTNSDNKTPNKNTQSDSNNKKPSTNQNNTTNNNQSNTNNESSNNTTNNNTNSNTNNNQTTSSKAPSSSKKVSLSRDRLYNKMMSIYTKPTLKFKEAMSKYDYAHQINGTIPSQVQYIYDWYFGIMDGGAETELIVSPADLDLFYSRASEILNYFPAYSLRETNDNTVRIMVTTKAKIDERVDNNYAIYLEPINRYNAMQQSNYDLEMQTYNSYAADVNLACDLVVNAVSKANVSGKDEVTAVNNIVNYICKNCEYWDWAATQQDSLGGSIKDCLQDKKAVCDGYAKTFYAMCYYAGIDVSYYNGTDDRGGSHAWNSVNINGTTYYFDVTWHDSIIATFPTDDEYIWCNKTEFSKEHIQKGTTIYFW